MPIAGALHDLSGYRNDSDRESCSLSHEELTSMHILLWVLQVLLAVFVAFTGVIHFVLPPNLPAPLHWMYDLSPPLHTIAGAAELLAAVGLILPGLTRIQRRLTPLAASGLVLLMLGAIVFHVSRGEIVNAVLNLVVAALAAFVAYGRWRISPLSERVFKRGYET
jgi:putative oxidoreductase